MATIQTTKVTLRIFGDKLHPESISEQLGHPPTKSQIKGERIIGRNTGKVRIAKKGCWLLQAENATPGNLDAQIYDLIEKLTNDMNTWGIIAKNNEMDLFCGLFMSGGMEGEGISAKNLLALGQRKIKLSLDIYAR